MYAWITVGDPRITQNDPGLPKDDPRMTPGWHLHGQVAHGTAHMDSLEQCNWAAIADAAPKKFIDHSAAVPAGVQFCMADILRLCVTVWGPC